MEAIRNFPEDSKEEKANAYQNLGFALWKKKKRRSNRSVENMSEIQS